MKDAMYRSNVTYHRFVRLKFSLTWRFRLLPSLTTVFSFKLIYRWQRHFNAWKSYLNPKFLRRNLNAANFQWYSFLQSYYQETNIMMPYVTFTPNAKILSEPKKIIVAPCVFDHRLDNNYLIEFFFKPFKPHLLLCVTDKLGY